MLGVDAAVNRLAEALITIGAERLESQKIPSRRAEVCQYPIRP